MFSEKWWDKPFKGQEGTGIFIEAESGIESCKQGQLSGSFYSLGTIKWLPIMHLFCVYSLFQYSLLEGLL